MKKVLEAIGPFIWVGVWLTFFVWFTKPYLSEAPNWVQILIIIGVLGVSILWLLKMTLKKESDENSNSTSV